MKPRCKHGIMGIMGSSMGHESCAAPLFLPLAICHSLVAPARPCAAASSPCTSSPSPPLLAGALKSKPLMRGEKLIELLVLQIGLREVFCEEAHLVSEPEQLACHHGLF